MSSSSRSAAAMASELIWCLRFCVFVAQGVVVADVAPRVETRSADELLAASERRAPEVSIAAAFYNTQTGQTTTTTRATKTQKRKHQINSLAIAAAERELELMEKRGRATKTKAETNAKYGW